MQRSNYWSCSKFADWLRGNIKPEAETDDGWRNWKKDIKSKHPIRYYIAEELLDNIQDIVFWPVDMFKKLQYFVRNIKSKSHILYHPTMKFGKYHEIDNKMLYCNFQALVDFIEVEKPWISVEYKKNFWRRERNREVGLKYLDWEINLKYDKDWGINENDPEYGSPTPQSISAKEQLDLYNWWTIERPKRIDPYEEEHFNKIQEQFGEKYYNEIEEKYYKEDTEMLIRLIKIRRHLWT